jgi:hypothetical protein
MEIQNSTSDDAMIRVSGGPGNTIKPTKPSKPAKPSKPSKPVDVPLLKGALISPKLPDPPFTLLFLVAGKEVCRIDVKSAVKRLKLTRVANDGFKIVKS